MLETKTHTLGDTRSLRSVDVSVGTNDTRLFVKG